MQRIEAGTLKGRRLKTLPRGVQVRPTGARVRGAIFDRLQAEIVGAEVLDLFAGSGALAIEALSRGAASATLVERDDRVVRFLREQLAALGLERRAWVHHTDALAFLARSRGDRPCFDVVFVDPPYDQPELCELAAARLVAGGWLAPAAILVCERERVGGNAPPAAWPAALELRATRVYGQTVLDFLELLPARHPPVAP